MHIKKRTFDPMRNSAIYNKICSDECRRLLKETVSEQTIEEDCVKKLIIAATMLAMTGSAFAEQAVDQLGSTVGTEMSETAVAIPAAPALDIEATVAMSEEIMKRDCGYNNGQHPGCPNFCKYHQTHASCALPFHCKNNMQLYACKKHCKDYPLSQGCAK